MIYDKVNLQCSTTGNIRWRWSRRRQKVDYDETLPGL